jgi:hypothetical protein
MAAPREHSRNTVKATIVYITGRTEPHVEWALQAIAQQRKCDDTLEFIIVDALDRPRAVLIDNQPLVESAVHDLRVVAPKPNIWQGKYRVTAEDWWAKSAASNTALCLASHDYVAFMDDCSRPGDNWLDAIRTGYRERKSVLAGAYEKIEPDGRKTPDHRLQLCPNGKKDCKGGWLYGCTFALPLDWCMEVNGFEEGCDGLSSEDYIFGFMLENNGRRIDFVPSMFVSLDREQQGNKYVRVDKGVSPKDKSHAARDRFGTRKSTEFTPDLLALRAQLARGETFPIPDPNDDYRDWYDGRLIRDATKKEK